MSMEKEKGTDFRKEEELWTESYGEEDMHLLDFKQSRPYISAFPVYMDAENIHVTDIPRCSFHGVEWEFVMQNPTDPFESTVITGKIAKEWKTSAESLMKAAEENIRRFLPYVRYRVLFGKVSDTVCIPFLKISFMADAEFPPTGASLYLSNEVAMKVGLILGDFYKFIANSQQLYVLPREPLKKYGLNPKDSFLNLYVSCPENGPQFFHQEPLFSAAEISEMSRLH